MEPLQVDSRILSLAAEVTESPDQDVPVLLLKIKGILTSIPPGSKESQKIKQDLYYYDLVQYCLLVLKQDYTRVLGGWATAVHIAEILSLCCVGLEVKEEPEEFYNKLLPSAVDNLLFLGKRLQVRCIRAIKRMIDYFSPQKGSRRHGAYGALTLHTERAKASALYKRRPALLARKPELSSTIRPDRFLASPGGCHCERRFSFR
uniref:IQ calmodulin-binding motif-containing protein 1 n=1 Tax=Sphaerodactylus townsendi TaxID=933632 RepID=A0ACB8G1P4_9SAUR